MEFIFLTFIVALVFSLLMGFIWVCIDILARKRLGERSRKSCELVGDSHSEHCCQFVEQCPEEIRSKCKHAILKP